MIVTQHHFAMAEVVADFAHGRARNHDIGNKVYTIIYRVHRKCGIYIICRKQKMGISLNVGLPKYVRDAFHAFREGPGTRWPMSLHTVSTPHLL